MLNKRLKLIFIGLVAGFCGIAAFAQEESVALKLHFSGTERLKANKEASQLNKILALDETTRFKTELFKRLSAQTAAAFFGENAVDRANLLEPLFESLFKNEWCLTIGAKGKTTSEAVLVVSTAGNDSSIWNTNLIKLSESLSGGKTANKKFGSASGWEGRLKGNLNLIRFAQVGDWVVVGLASNKFNIFDELLPRVQKKSFPEAFNSNNWLEASIDLRWLSRAMNTPFSGGANYAVAAMYSRGGDTRTVAMLHYGSPIKWNYETWQPPMGLIYDPLVSFTAINGSASLLNEIDIIKRLKLQSLPNQLYIWAQGSVPFATYFAVPVKNSTNLMNELAVKLPPTLINTNSLSTDGNIFWFSNRAELVWQGLPLMTPFLRSASDTNGQYIFGGLFPAPPSEKKPAPRELYQQFLGRTNLMYYDWEFTRERLLQWFQTYQILPLFTRIPQAAESKTGQKWIVKIAPELGDAATQMYLNSPNEVVILRRSTIGLTGFELLQLARWVDLPEKANNGNLQRNRRTSK